MMGDTTTAPDAYPGRGRVLVIGRSLHVNRGVVEPLVEQGVDARGCTEPEDASHRFNARDFDLIVFGRGVLGPVGTRLKSAFSETNPDARFIDVIAPMAVEQTIAALTHDPRVPRFVTGFECLGEGGIGIGRLSATILAPCSVTVTLFRVVGGTMASELVLEEELEPGPSVWRMSADSLAGANSLLLIANGNEFHLHPVEG